MHCNFCVTCVVTVLLLNCNILSGGVDAVQPPMLVPLQLQRQEPRPLVNPIVSKMLNEYKIKITDKMGILFDESSWNETIVFENDGTELGLNAEVAGDLLDGDMVPNKEQMEYLLAQLEDGDTTTTTTAPRKTRIVPVRRRFGPAYLRQRLWQRRGGGGGGVGGRGAFGGTTFGKRKKRKTERSSRPYGRWPATIPYFLMVYDQNAVNVIQGAIAKWQRETCLDFQYTMSSWTDSIYFFQDRGCYSPIGRQGTGPQPISIGQGCDVQAIVEHEIGHALGLWHEQSLPERDNYVNIVMKNVQPRFAFNFEKKSPSSIYNFGIPYDLGSVMHYGPKAFTYGPGVNSIETLDPNYQDTIGQREGISFTDIKAVNMDYCGRICTNTLECQKGGYPDPRDCNRCKCPRGFTGRYCEELAISTGGCGEDMVATRNWQTIKTTSTGPGQDCFWRFKTGDGGKIQCDIQNIDYPPNPPNHACSSYLEVKYGPNYQSAGPRFCGGLPHAPLGWSTTNEVILIHHTSPVRGGSFGGFQARCKADGVAPPTLPTRKKIRPTKGRRVRVVKRPGGRGKTEVLGPDPDEETCVSIDGSCAMNGDPLCKKKDGYTGTKSETKNGLKCQRWDRHTPHSHSDPDPPHHNHCRNPDQTDGPWCYTTDPNTRWEYCFETCEKCGWSRWSAWGECEGCGDDAFRTRDKRKRSESGGSSNKCSGGKLTESRPCVDWGINPPDCPKGGSSGENGSSEETNNNSNSCVDEELNCSYHGEPDCRSADAYHGIKNETMYGKQCQTWSSQSPNQHQFKSIGDHNYCRNPEGKELAPWCFTTDPNVKWDYCFDTCHGPSIVRDRCKAWVCDKDRESRRECRTRRKAGNCMPNSSHAYWMTINCCRSCKRTWRRHPIMGDAVEYSGESEEDCP